MILSDGVIHGIERLLIPNTRRSLSSIPAVPPEGAPEKPVPPVSAGAPPVQVATTIISTDVIQILLHKGGYIEMADILVNLTSFASEMGRLISEGYVLTVLAPNDEAMVHPSK
ncbi:AT5G06390 [Olea europaea subsp. europaea]|uniref:AT5G06390, partial n=1 Tax=Olea europaea subsp. europaea TaxID=158383 RepID=A0A8S0UJM4_OLEEU|nr:AT5G06390 [Olea europaea subsp. europaea]